MDATSGLTTSSPAKFTLTASAESKGANEPTVVSRTVTDQAGNTATRSLSALIDRAAPTASLTPSGTQGQGGWYTGDVTFAASGTDALSGGVTCTQPGPLTTDSASFTATTTCTDAAGNPATASSTVKRDSAAPAAPTITANGTKGQNGWYTGDVTFSATSTDALSTVTCTQPATLNSDSAAYTASTVCADAAGNTSKGSLEVKRDATAPSASITPSGTLVNGWYNTNVTFATAGTDATSGGVTCSVIPAQTTDTNGITVSTTCTDAAGNSNRAELGVKRDATAPVISGSNVNDTTWRNRDRSEAFTSSDGGSGLADGGDASFTLTASDDSKGANTRTTVSRTVTDRAGNSAVRTLSALIDTAVPVISGSDIADGAWRNTDLSQAYTASDALSGLTTSSPATFTLTASAQSANATTPTVVTQIVTDQAGNSTTRTLSARIDKTAPVVSANVADTTWRNTDFKGSFTASDALSGLEKASDVDFDLVVSAESDNSTTPSVVAYIVKDAAGNSTTRQASAFIDRTAPTTTLTPGGTLGLAGWYVSDVTFKATGTDALSGGVTCTQPGALTSDTNSTDVSASCTDAAGNSKAAELTVKRDTTAPTVSGPDIVNATWRNTNLSADSTSSDKGSGLAEGSDATFTLTASDESKSAAAPTLVSRIVKDQAGNATTRALSALIDKTVPTITGSRTPSANSSGWNNSDVTASFVCTDGLSGQNSCTDSVTLANEGAGQSVIGTATDKAGNSASFTVGNINIDKTAPTIALSSRTAPNAAGWNKTDVTATFTCDDSLSGMVNCDPVTVSTEGKGQSVTRTVQDRAGNSASYAVSNVNIDKTAPTFSGSLISPLIATSSAGAALDLGTLKATDPMSGVSTSGVICTPTSLLFGSNPVGCTAQDQAGNTATRDPQSVSVTLGNIYTSTFNLLSPLKNTPSDLSLVKLGSTLPVKLTAPNYVGGAATDLASGLNMKVSYKNVSISDSTYEVVDATATGSTVWRYDATTNQYIYNLSTKTGFSNAGEYDVTITYQGVVVAKGAFNLKK